MKKVKIIAHYLPQFHEIPENNKWWGKSYTDWVAVRNSQKLFINHDQPRVPLGGNYYDLSKIESIRHQVELANQYGVWGFNIYHYWFDSKTMLLQKPAELIHENQDLNIHYMFTWDNESWRRSWSKKNVQGNDWSPQFDSKEHTGDGMLAKLTYGDQKDWKIHFDYLLKFFLDDRYIKIDGCPLFGIYVQDNDPDTISKMCEYWNELAKTSGFQGMKFIGKKKRVAKALFETQYWYEPERAAWTTKNIFAYGYNLLQKKYLLKAGKPLIKSYDYTWKKILSSAKKCQDNNIFYGAFVGFDDTPRRNTKARIILGGTPEKFQTYLTKLLQISKQQNKEYIFMTAWNEWGEGAYLEPDNRNGFAYLEALKQSLIDTENV